MDFINTWQCTEVQVDPTIVQITSRQGHVNFVRDSIHGKVLVALLYLPLELYALKLLFPEAVSL